MRILMLTTAFNSLAQRVWVELGDLGHEVSVELALGPSHMIEAVALFDPDLVVAPFLKAAIPAQVWQRHVCLVVHPGVPGDRGPCPLDWAILRDERQWGVTVLQAIGEWDAGPVWAWRPFTMRPVSKSVLYREEVNRAAVASLLEAVERFEAGEAPTPLDEMGPERRGRPHQPIKPSDRAVDWTAPTEVVARAVRSADSQPGLRVVLGGRECYAYGAHEEDRLRGRPGALIAQRDGAVCVATGDGALWITHLRLKGAGRPQLRAARVLGEALDGVPEAPVALDAPGDGRTLRDLRYEEAGEVGLVTFEAYNGALSTALCSRLREAVLHARGRPTKVIVVANAGDFWSNGIDLYEIHAAADPAAEAWRNIVAIDDLVESILGAESHLVVSALAGNAAAGGVALALAADIVLARRGIVLNPHYRGMGGLHGSEYWTYLLPRRLGAQRTREVMEPLLPLGASRARDVGLIDELLDDDAIEFRRSVLRLCRRLAAAPDFGARLAEKREARARDQRQKPLEEYRREELEAMRLSFFGPDPSFHQARRRFVEKVRPDATPLHLARHRR